MTRITPLVALILLLTRRWSLSSASPFDGDGPEGDLGSDMARQQQDGCCYAAGQAVPSGRVPVPRRMAFIIGAQKAGAGAGRRAGRAGETPLRRPLKLIMWLPSFWDYKAQGVRSLHAETHGI